MKISIITVCKNAEDKVRKTIESVVSQTFSDIEYIVVDGASADGTLRVFNEYSGAFPVKIISEEDSGIYSAMNKGISMASGDYLLFLNAGDYLFNRNVVSIVHNSLKKSDADIIYGLCLNIDPETGAVEFDEVQKLDNYLFYYSAMPHQAMFYRRELFELYGNYNENYKIISDHELNYRFYHIDDIKWKKINVLVSVHSYGGMSTSQTFEGLHNKERDNFTVNSFSWFEKLIFGSIMYRLYRKAANAFKFFIKQVI
ncbi:MAG: glycosyltransferase [Desulfobacteraceae bacterium]|nr:glycosyltransferase [Desulfobacteraceae bacterium]